MSRDMKFADASGDERAVAPEIPKEERYLRTQAYDKSVGDLVSMMRNGDIILNPDYQRNYIWDNRKASLLIESILLNVPIPIIYVYEDEESHWVVVDGLQRLYTLRRFFDNELKLVGLEVLIELKRSQFSTLNPKAERILKNGIIRVITILKESHPEIKYDIFQRLNRGAIRLNEQELRNCAFRGAFNDLLKRLRENDLFLKCLGFKKPHKRFYDAEFILRYFALSENFDSESGKVSAYSSKMKTFLNNFMEEKRKVDSAELEQFERRFVETVEKVYLVFGRQAFRRITTDGLQESRINRALMDVVMVGFEQYSLDWLEENKKEILRIYCTLPESDSRFFDAISYGTSDTKKLEYRLTTWSAALRNLV